MKLTSMGSSSLSMRLAQSITDSVLIVLKFKVAFRLTALRHLEYVQTPKIPDYVHYPVLSKDWKDKRYILEVFSMEWTEKEFSG